MKKLILFGLFALIGWTSFYDVTKGTLSILAPGPTPVAAKSVQNISTDINYRKVDISPGDTVLSVVEQLNPHASESIPKFISDFKKLNPNTDPNHIQIGETYRFPIYKAK